MRTLLTAIFLIVLAVLPAYADSDGYYCVGPDYLAVEFRSFSTPSISGPHVLKLLHFDEELGPRWTGEVVAEDFQTHVLTCGTARIVFEGVGDSRRGLVSYVVEFDSTGWPQIRSVSNDPSYVFVPRNGPANLGLWARPGITPLPSVSKEHHFQLRVTESAHRKDRAILHDKRTVIEELDSAGQLFRSLQITEGTQMETID
jgi:hypothetical protein